MSKKTKCFIGISILSVGILLAGCGQMSKDEAIKDIKRCRSAATFTSALAYNLTNAKIRNIPSQEYDAQLKELEANIKSAEDNIKHLKGNMSEYREVSKEDGYQTLGFAYDILWEAEAVLGQNKTLRKKMLLTKSTLDSQDVSKYNLWYNPKYQYSLVDFLGFSAIQEGHPYGNNRPFWGANPRHGWTRAYVVPYKETTFLVSVCECTITHDGDYSIIAPVVRVKNIGSKPYRLAYSGLKMDRPNIRLLLSNMEFSPYESYHGTFDCYEKKLAYNENADNEYLNPGEEIFVYDTAFKVPYYLTKYDEIDLRFYCSSIFRNDNYIDIDANAYYRQNYQILRHSKVLSNQYDVNKPSYKKYVPMKFLLNDKEFPMVYTGGAIGEDTELYLSLPSLQVVDFSENSYGGYDLHSYFSVISNSGMITSYNLQFEYDKTGNQLMDVLDLGERTMPGVAPLLDTQQYPWIKNIGKIVRDIYVPQFEKLLAEYEKKENNK